MIFSSRFKIAIVRFFQLALPVFSVLFFTEDFPNMLFKSLWLVALIVFEVIAQSTVNAIVTENGIAYRRLLGPKQIAWDSIESARLWVATGGVVLRLKDRPLWRRYLFLLDSSPSITRVLASDPIERDPGVTRLIAKLTVSE